MKRYLGMILCCLLLLVGCSEKKEETVVPPGKLVSAVAESQSKKGGLNVLSGDVLEGYLQSCGLTEWEDAAVWTGEGMDGREITVVLLADEKAAKSAAECLEAHRQSRIGDFFGYSPEQAELLENAQVLLQGRCAAFLACEEMEAAKAAFDACYGGENFQPVAVEPAQSTEPALNSEIDPGLDISGFPKYVPPNDVDMTLYDNTAVVNAWRSGDETGLSEKDKVILARCREIFNEIISEDMTDFETELALHDWLIRNGRYDEQSRDNVAHIGQPDNNDPYGMLNGGYGICLGFATTFQLFMDLAEIECITVVGAAYGSTADHAWNMVKLDGEWYCVDVTWDNSGETSVNTARGTHKYFNVTSERLRETNHQWDYRNVPEATATHYRWDGVSALPT